MLLTPKESQLQWRNNTVCTTRPAGLTVMLCISVPAAFADENPITLRLDDPSLVQPHNVTAKAVRFGGDGALEVR